MPATRRGRLLLFALPALLMAGYLLALRGWQLITSDGPGSGAVQEIDLKALGNFPLDWHTGEDGDIPVRWRELEGRRVSFKGFMVPMGSAGPSVNRFQVVYSVQRSSKRGPPLVQERVFATASRPVSLYSVSTLVQIQDVFHAGVERDESGIIGSVFRLDAEAVAPVPPVTPSVAAAEPPGITKWDLLALTYLLLACLVGYARWSDRRHRARCMAGLCPICGYDLRATPHRCPECGSMFRRSQLPPNDNSDSQ